MSDALLCPVCPEHPPLRPLDLQRGLRVPLRRCDDCHGVWADAETAAIAADHYHESHYVTRPGHGRQRCRHCAAWFAEPKQECPKCGAGQALACVGCSKPMRLVEVEGVTLDVCVPCRGVWFDRGELGLVIYSHGEKLRRRIDAERGETSLRRELGVNALDAVPSAIDAVDLAHVSGRAAVEVTTTVVEGGSVDLVAGAGNLAVSAGEAVAEGASVAVEAVVEVVAGIFSGV